MGSMYGFPSPPATIRGMRYRLRTLLIAVALGLLLLLLAAWWGWREYAQWRERIGLKPLFHLGAVARSEIGV